MLVKRRNFSASFWMKGTSIKHGFPVSIAILMLNFSREMREMNHSVG